MSAEEQPRDRKAYLEEQIRRKERGEPIDVEWVKAELLRVKAESQRRIAGTERRLRLVVLFCGVMFLALWLFRRAAEGKDPVWLAPALFMVVLIAFVVRRSRNR